MKSNAKELLCFDSRLCGECGGCVAVCSLWALELLPSGLHVRKDLCTLCEDCVVFCPTGALMIRDPDSRTEALPERTLLHENG
jgi:Fe-S-cluster-containing hydrogenase component 2